MSRVELPGKRFATARISHVTGDVAWWVFIVGRLMSELAWGFGGLPRRYADYGGDSLFGAGLGRGDYGWTAYEPLTDKPPSVLTDTMLNANIVSVIAVVALAVTVIAAVVEAVAHRRWRTGVLTVVAPVVGAAIILAVLYERDGYLGGGGLDLPLLVVFALVLLGVGVREMWSRVWAPRGTRAT